MAVPVQAVGVGKNNNCQISLPALLEVFTSFSQVSLFFAELLIFDDHINYPVYDRENDDVFDDLYVRTYRVKQVEIEVPCFRLDAHPMYHSIQRCTLHSVLFSSMYNEVNIMSRLADRM